MSVEYTEEQHISVKRVMKLKPEAYYEILQLQKTCTSSEIKKAYKRQALLMHPDKNKAPNSDEAFRRVSKAFQILSDETKRKIFDQTGTDPESRASMGGGPAGFGRSPFGRNAQFQTYPANDIFSQFFGGPGMAGGGMGGGPQFQFQFGGDPNDIFSQLFGDALFGGARRPPPRTRQQQAQQQAQQSADQSNGKTAILNLLLIAAVLIVPTVLGWTFDSSGSSSPGFRFDNVSPYTQQRFTPKYNVPFYVNPKDLEKLSPSKQKTLDRMAENQFVSSTRQACTNEYLNRQQLMQDAMGWFSTDKERYEEAKNMPLPHCDILNQLNIRLRE